MNPVDQKNHFKLHSASQEKLRKKLKIFANTN